ncbi:hydrogenobyrinate a,c-diamide synthase [Acrocarpospora corrugata]|uniref:Hydrogenobyrinate a,c-diamide synthase n=1 Tax=Acrocarpospora corrugata TaxID=35763 RepID=A0A5M3W4R1_9ACTN|nr:cobyrinate a,c-diamide synthase [Acrocarpospora corrugata]GES04047.1 hydrogenobyrinate a,c-diamide synthase [Acrocarpospora corrugata]
MVRMPRLVIAAPASGAGKTTIATGLMAALVRRGLTVSPHKVGPDYIDPGYHALATGRPGRNLDPWLTSEDLVAPLFLHGSEGADIAVIEGVMGLYDGMRGTADFASTAHVARLLEAPVVLVVDATGQGQSVAALVHGFASYDTRVRLAGIILNRVGSPRHEQVCRESLESTGIPVLGAIPRTSDAATPSRHLGLVPVAERHAEARRAIATLATLTESTCDIPALIAAADQAAPLSASPWSAWSPSGLSGTSGLSNELSPPGPSSAAGPEPLTAAGPRPVVAIAGGAAFTFGYAEQAELLVAAGAEVVTFDPVHDEDLPPGTRGILLPGGFPEIYAEELSANQPMRAKVAEFAANGGAIVAECAGLLYLSAELDGHPMCSIIDAKAEMTGRLTLGYRDAVAVRDSVLTRAGERYRGHEFHRTACTPPANPLWRWNDGADGYASGGVLASYLHLHWAGSPVLARRFVEACR